MRACLLVLALLLPEVVAAAEAGNRLSKRTQLRYQDVLTTREGSRWRGKLIQRGDVFRIRLEDQSEVAVPKEEVASITRELHPGLLHDGQWIARVTPGVELAVALGETSGAQYGAMAEVAFGRNFGGGLEPELLLVVTPIGPDDGRVTVQAGVGARYYMQQDRKVKPYTSTHVIVTGTRGDLGLRTGPGLIWDLGQGVALGVNQGVTLMTQSSPESVAVGYHVGVSALGKF